jgi:hypothetical protein
MVVATSEGVSDSALITIGPGRFLQIGIGRTTFCGIIGNRGIAYCWGATPALALTAVPEPTVATQAFSSVYPSVYGACALESGRALCWGTEYSNSFGSGVSHPSPYFVPEPTEVAGHHSFVELSAQLGVTCGVTVEHEGYCWGSKPEGGIGNGDTSAVAPAMLAGGLSWSSVSVGEFGHSCGITTAGLAYCWGTNYSGELGTGDTVPSLYPVPVTGGLLFKSIAPGNYFTCAVASTDEAYCWGSRGSVGGASGALGEPVGSNLGTTAPHEYCHGLGVQCNKSPVPVAGGLKFAALGTGQFFSCGLTTSGAVFCWGRNESGQLGISSAPDRCGSANYGFYPCSLTPHPINSSLKFSDIGVGMVKTCGIADEQGQRGRVYCWGQNIVDGGFSASPVRVPDP